MGEPLRANIAHEVRRAVGVCHGMLRQRDCGDQIGLKGAELMANKFSVRGFEEASQDKGP